MKFEKIDIHELLPQQEPFVMVGRLCHFDMDKTVTKTKISDKNIFVENGVLTTPGIIETIAQSCAARIGYVNKYILKKCVQIGFIGAVRNMNLYRCPEVGEEIETTIITIEEIFGMTLVSATVRAGDEIIAESEMKIASRVEDSRSE